MVGFHHVFVLALAFACVQFILFVRYLYFFFFVELKFIIKIIKSSCLRQSV